MWNFCRRSCSWIHHVSLIISLFVACYVHHMKLVWLCWLVSPFQIWRSAKSLHFLVPHSHPSNAGRHLPWYTWGPMIVFTTKRHSKICLLCTLKLCYNYSLPLYLFRANIITANSWTILLTVYSLKKFSLSTPGMYRGAGRCFAREYW
jgi:hypothetical protein